MGSLFYICLLWLVCSASLGYMAIPGQHNSFHTFPVLRERCACSRLPYCQPWEFLFPCENTRGRACWNCLFWVRVLSFHKLLQCWLLKLLFRLESEYPFLWVFWNLGCNHGFMLETCITGFTCFQCCESTVPVNLSISKGEKARHVELPMQVNWPYLAGFAVGL